MAGGGRTAGQSVTGRALAVLAAFSAEHPQLSLSEIARRADLPLTTAHRLIGELEAWQALERRPDGRYAIGRRLWSLGLLAPVQLELREVALPHLQDLFAITGENVHLAVREDTHALYLERLSGRSSVPVVSRAGGRLPLHATGVGKVLLAHAPPDVVAAVLGGPLERVTRYTVTEPGRLARELADTRRRGWARTAEEMTLGTTSVAVPVMAPDGTVLAALGLVTASRRDIARLVPAVQVAAAGITRRLTAAPA